MKIIFLVFMTFVISGSLEASEKRVVFEKFEDMPTAQTKFKEFKKTKLYEEVEALASGNDIKIDICSSDEYIAIVANPISNQYILSAITNAIKQEFTKSFSEEFSGRCDIKTEQVEKVENNETEDLFLDNLLKELDDENISKAVTKVEKTKEEILEQARLAELKRNLEVIRQNKIKKSNESESLFSWWYIFLLIIFIIFYILYKKYKPIYDEY